MSQSRDETRYPQQKNAKACDFWSFIALFMIVLLSVMAAGGSLLQLGSGRLNLSEKSELWGMFLTYSFAALISVTMFHFIRTMCSMAIQIESLLRAINTELRSKKPSVPQSPPIDRSESDPNDDRTTDFLFED